MGRLVVVEGLDGAGKRTLTESLTAALRAQGATVTTLAFPRYGRDVHADLVREALHGAHGDLADSVYGMALLYALDRRDAADEIRLALSSHDVVLLDRYVASNAAYQAARLGEGVDGPVVRWVRDLEIDRFGLPVPDRQLLLRVPVDLAARRARTRAEQDTSRKIDAFESDDTLQARCSRMYDALAERGWLSQWHVLDGTRERSRQGADAEQPEDVAALATSLYLGK
ncbi:thymidylate kinase [Saccharomonospora piscinae]|uniref:Thymidylate kinase n=1 Tax=Saccharomonospora piscinae TaxID=687388 RepID=A0A1V9A5R0_SACPI|nr:dTMP kinase [Saccharomonospora piscinae]OQO92380.1 thymidylate kinase [Saccharomonospora piscinae]TLW91903.1 dTMP kinase [Saccharomonospora piscinae]